MRVARSNQRVNFAAHAIFLCSNQLGAILMKLSRHASAVKKYVHFRLAPRADHADDIVQDVFLAAWENLHAYRGNSSLRSWLMGIARNKVRDYYRAILREPRPLETANENFRIKISPLEFDDQLEKEFARKKTWEILHKLPKKYRVVLIWRYWNECSVKALAIRIGKTEKATERLLARARDEFRWVWEQQARDSRLIVSERAA
jgi:RNA polymerase sigma-70 factor, ECF subfamily